MCGIAGYLQLRASAVDCSEGRLRLRAMAQALAHRGPDDEDIYIDGPIGLAHRRLAVIDPAPHGRQPMRRESATIVFNGEIYNYRELRRELESIGEVFRTGTDTEVLLAAYLRWGDRCFDRFSGMFAVAIWNGATRRLTLARDKIGKKPLYFARTSDLLLFGSEIKAILTWPEFARVPNLEALHHYLSLQYVPSPLTAFDGVEALSPGSILTVEIGRSPGIRRYWTPPAPAPDRQVSWKEAREAEAKTRELLKSAVETRMVADVPIGAFLSGGIDSSSVCAMMAGVHDRPIKTFSIGFDEPEYDERRFARHVAQAIGAEHREEIVRPDAVELLQDLVWHFGQPFADPSSVPTYLVAQLAREDVTVVLTGDGGDEFFLGYQRYADYAALERYERWPRYFRAVAGRFARAMPPRLVARRPFGGLKRRLDMLGATRAERYAPAMMYFQDLDKPVAYGERMRSYLSQSSPDLLSPFLDSVPGLPSAAAWADSQTYLPDDLLVKVDVSTMAFGLEARAPFLDVELMEHAQSLPQSLKMPGGVLKGHLKQALAGILPAEIINRKKMGFGVPIDEWFRKELVAFAGDVFTSSAMRTRGIFADGYPDVLLAEHRTGKRQHHTRLWAMLMMELWFREWID